MTMKKTELEKRAGLKVAHQMKQAAARAQRAGASAKGARAPGGLAAQLIERALTSDKGKTTD